mmetsp:Transcript_29755/g.48043  ORF Transcript_29755/g.48043 Transcript_29755/m.48043 type:complete len:313 (-) Transcript_29755:447-1385(-)|eukprot:CAMPEP_0184645054 /NCGR_PEP_ID=MMETSP0308-20130426/1615_1 /TAXON_ID=38269 /ORGANISM="Gloeochaete witrockiana, Strain SAG 46.84" /LENGTH=312 /DNA_ID=CAMNT_0027073853 /DNA_START=58 /DNA_END=996 /DNA_ORIENTATION=+
MITTETPARAFIREDFEFGQQLGEGSYGHVVKAKCRSSGEEYAVKIMDKRYIIKENKVVQVKREKTVLALLYGHPNIIKLFATFQDANSLYLVLELVAGGEMLQMIKQLEMSSESIARFYAAEILNAIEFMHFRDVVHRDLKPENMLLSAAGHLKVIDFGSAKLLSEASSGASSRGKHSFVGTAEYVAPEVLLDKGAGKAADLWAFGCILFQMLAARPPFRGGSEYLTFQKILNLEYSFPKNIPPKARDLIEKLLVLDPEQRFGSGANGISAIKTHAFFEGIDFANLEKLEAPLRPSVAQENQLMYNTVDIL